VDAVLTHAEAIVQIVELNDGRRRIDVEVTGGATYVHRKSCDTSYPIALIAKILEIKGPAYLCDEISRDEDNSYIEPHLRTTLFAHVEPSEFVGKRLLDFGCGSGASTAIMARLLPATSIVGIDLESDFLGIARARAAFYGLDTVRFELSKSGEQLPTALGNFDFIILPAVYEHLLPQERERLMPQLWRHLNKDGVLFIDETPHRWFPIESHTSSLPLVNYLPDPLAHRFVRTCSRRQLADATWPDLLRKGVRGASVREIMRMIPGGKAQSELIKPRHLGARSAVDVWCAGYAQSSAAKRALGKMLKLLQAVTHAAPVPYLSLAIRKVA